MFSKKVRVGVIAIRGTVQGHSPAPRNCWHGAARSRKIGREASRRDGQTTASNSDRDAKSTGLGRKSAPALRAAEIVRSSVYALITTARTPRAHLPDLADQIGAAHPGEAVVGHQEPGPSGIAFGSASSALVAISVA